MHLFSPSQPVWAPQLAPRVETRTSRARFQAIGRPLQRGAAELNCAPLYRSRDTDAVIYAGAAAEANPCSLAFSAVFFTSDPSSSIQIPVQWCFAIRHPSRVRTSSCL